MILRLLFGLVVVCEILLLCFRLCLLLVIVSWCGLIVLWLTFVHILL